MDTAGSSELECLIDEVRLWTCARDEKEIADDRHYRLVGQESGLAAYWRFDEGSGSRLHDQTDDAGHGALVTIPQSASSNAWVASDAPVGEQPGIRRTSFHLEGLAITSALSAILYHQNETIPPSDGFREPL